MWNSWSRDQVLIHNVGKVIEATPLQGSWSTGKVLLVRGTGGRAIVKRWAGETAAGHCHAEVAALRRHRADPLPIAPEPVALNGSLDPWSPDPEVLLTAQERIPGSPLDFDSRMSPAMAARLGRVLAALHGEEVSPPPGARSRLHSLNELPEMTGIPPAALPLIERAWATAGNFLDDVCGLPSAWIHGDVSFENILYDGGSLRLIDFEFSRRDIRVLDLAALRTPWRDKNGVLRAIDREFQQAAAEHYSRAAPRRLSREEARLTPVTGLLYLLMIVRDQLLAGGRHLPLVLPALADLTDQLTPQAVTER